MVWGWMGAAGMKGEGWCSGYCRRNRMRDGGIVHKLPSTVDKIENHAALGPSALVMGLFHML